MSDREDDEVSDDGDYLEVEEDIKDESREGSKRLHAPSSDSYDFGVSMDEYDENDENEGPGDEEDRKNASSDPIDDIETVQTDTLNNHSVAYTETTDDRSKFQQACFDTMRMLRLATSKTITTECAGKALDLVYDHCKARFHAKERLGSSGAAEYLRKIFRRWRSDTDVMIRCAEVISEFVINETENKILMGIQGIGHDIVATLEEHRRHWPAIQALSRLIVDLCNSKLPGMLQKNFSLLAIANQAKPINGNITEDAKIFEQTRLDESSMLETVEKTLKGELTNADKERKVIQDSIPSEVGNDLFMNIQNGHKEGEVSIDAHTPEDGNDYSVNILNADSVLNEDQWLLDNREHFGRAGICHIITHIVSLICGYQNAAQLSGRRSGGNSASSTPRHHLKRNNFAGGSTPRSVVDDSGDKTQQSPVSVSLPPLQNISSRHHAGSTAASNDASPVDQPTNNANLPAISKANSYDLQDTASMANSRPLSGSIQPNTLNSQSHISPAMAESLRLQLPPILLPGNTGGSAVSGSLLQSTFHKDKVIEQQQNNSSHSSGRSPMHHHTPKNTPSQRNQHNMLQQVLYSNHEWPIDDLIATLMHAVAVLSDYEPNAKRFGKEGLCLYITHLLKDKSATSANVIASTRGNTQTNSFGSLPSPGGGIGPRLPIQFIKTNALLWAMILLSSDSKTGNKERFGEAGATFLLIDRLHEIMRNVETYRKDSASRRYVEYVSWALLNLVLDSPLNCMLVKQVTYADVILDHLITMEVEMQVPESSLPGNNSESQSSLRNSQKSLVSKTRAKEALYRSNPVSSTGGSRKAPASSHNPSVPMVTVKEFAMSAGTRQKLGRIMELVYCVL